MFVNLDGLSCAVAIGSSISFILYKHQNLSRTVAVQVEPQEMGTQRLATLAICMANDIIYWEERCNGIEVPVSF